MEWTEEVISRLQSLWQEGLSTAEIGRQLSITKNAVVGKAHRLGLPPRPSPIRKPSKDGVEASSGASVKAVSAEKVSAKPPTPEMSATVTPKAVVSTEAAASEAVVTAKAAPHMPSTVAETVPTPEPVAALRKARAAMEAGASSSPPIDEVPKAIEAPIPSPVAAKPVPKPVLPTPTVTAKSVAARASEESLEKIAEAHALSQSLRPVLRSITGDTSTRRGPSCCWPLGDPGTPGFHFCGAKPLPGKPYCADHAALAYVKLRDRRDNVA